MGQADTATTVEQGLMSGAQHRQGFLQVWRSWLTGLGLGEGGIGNVAQQQVLGDINPDRAGSTALG